MSKPGQSEQTGSIVPVTVAGLYVLARINTWKVRTWQPKTDRRPALIVLDDPHQSSVNPGVVGRLMDTGLVDGAGGTLVVTEAGTKALLDRPDVVSRMRASGAI